jgi:hypothetical protein
MPRTRKPLSIMVADDATGLPSVPPGTIETNRLVRQAISWDDQETRPAHPDFKPEHEPGFFPGTERIQ